MSSRFGFVLAASHVAAVCVRKVEYQYFHVATDSVSSAICVDKANGAGEFFMFFYTVLMARRQIPFDLSMTRVLITATREHAKHGSLVEPSRSRLYEVYRIAARSSRTGLLNTNLKRSHSMQIRLSHSSRQSFLTGRPTAQSDCFGHQHCPAHARKAGVMTPASEG